MPGMSSLRSAVSSRDSSAANSVTSDGAGGDGEVEEEDRAPGDLLGQPAADSGPIASARAETPAQVPIAFPRSAGGNALVMIESVPGIISAAPTPCTAREATSQPSVGARPIVAEASGEDDDAEQEDPAAAEDVAEPAAGDEQDGEGERVRVDGPLERGQRRVEVRLDRRQRDVHDGVVEHDHEEGEAHRGERPPAAVVVGETEPFGHAGRDPFCDGEEGVVQRGPLVVGQRGGERGEHRLARLGARGRAPRGPGGAGRPAGSGGPCRTRAGRRSRAARGRRCCATSRGATSRAARRGP